MRNLIFLFLLIAGDLTCRAQNFVKDNYTKREVYIPMRDGVRLFTSIYIPKDPAHGPYPFLMERTPYSAGPYGDSSYRGNLGPNAALSREPFIFVYQDVRGRYMSEGSFQEMTPHKEGKKPGDGQTDESSDTWDTVDWLLKNIQGNNGRVGIWGISYPGFYASASLPDAHPAIKAVSPQAPVTDEFIGDDANHNGAFFLLDNFDFDNFFDIERPAPVKDYGHNIFNADIRDAYQFFLDLGPIRNTNNPEYFNNKGKIWNEYLGHPTYDAYWQARNIRTHLQHIRPAVLVVGGWFDAEDMFGALRTYEAIEKQTPHNDNHLIMGPWTHGGWGAGNWPRFGVLDFGQNVNDYYHQLETGFFNHYLKDSVDPGLSEATVFETGSNQWRHYDRWPPAAAHPVKFYLRAEGRLSTEGEAATARAPGKAAAGNPAYDEYVSDPAHPVPYIDGVRGGRDNQYMVADQRWAAQRPDVLTYQTDTLKRDLTVTGRLRADIFLSSTGTDADLVVKLIDVLPDGYQRLVRAEVFRCKFRNSFTKPEPLVPGKIAEVAYDLNEIAHTFKQGHRVMVQVQSSWFPLVDLNPQTFVNIPTCSAADFRKATIRMYHDATHLSGITLPVISQ
ncbi:MAG: X-Pro dipeptidyl-peptidase [Sphingobacteriales bacterium 50-39]|nr:CocE/NonD family hydrolase [Sphingobacteriales bacterium]OJW55460.1 MAG: X-Pro dipeptidyl-peptidase [Sphingobacteriales bacterium 50-39]